MKKKLIKNVIIFLNILIISIVYYQFSVCKDCQSSDTNLSLLFEQNSQFIAKDFVFPVAPPKAKGYYNAQKFGKVNKAFGGNLHLGEDWNSVKGGNNDLGDPVYAISNGYISFIGDGGPGWGTVIRIVHKLPQGSQYTFIESLYGHVIDVTVKQGNFVKKRERIAGIGNVNGLYSAHLHLEMRSDITLPIGGGYADNLIGFIHPTKFIKKHLRK